MKYRSALLLSTVATALALGGCASSVKLNKAPVASANSANGAQSGGIGQSNVNAGPAASVARSVFFAFDRYNVDAKYAPVIDGNGQYLAAHATAHVQLQGNCDARGSREYNLALGQKRAESVLKALELQGAKASQMEAVSYGKEKPRATGKTEADYAQNRRTDIAYGQ